MYEALVKNVFGDSFYVRMVCFYLYRPTSLQQNFLGTCQYLLRFEEQPGSVHFSFIRTMVPYHESIGTEQKIRGLAWNFQDDLFLICNTRDIHQFQYSFVWSLSFSESWNLVGCIPLCCKRTITSIISMGPIRPMRYLIDKTRELTNSLIGRIFISSIASMGFIYNWLHWLKVLFCQLPLLNSLTSFCFILLFSWLIMENIWEYDVAIKVCI